MGYVEVDSLFPRHWVKLSRYMARKYENKIVSVYSLEVPQSTKY